MHVKGISRYLWEEEVLLNRGYEFEVEAVRAYQTDLACLKQIWEMENEGVMLWC